MWEWLSRWGGSVDLDVVKRRVQESMICRDLGILFGASVDLDVGKKRMQESTICRDLGIAFERLCRPRRFCSGRIFQWVLDENERFCNIFCFIYIRGTMKIVFLNEKIWLPMKKSMICCKFFDDHLYTGMCENIDFSLKKTMIFVWKMINFKWKMHVCCAFFNGIYTPGTMKITIFHVTKH